ncbi:MAG: hypothetical protein K0S76_2061 [Herbinix sp.]|jgi:ABC-2 type transport system permease protein|nr:hypothetical protein [Herbinix sp.]
MTSKNLFLKLLREDLKRRIWSIALSMLVFFLFLTVNCALTVETLSDPVYRAEDWVIYQIIKLVGPNNEMVFILTIISAIVCGISGFYYLHSRKKVDLFHSIPVRREILFTITYVNGLLIYFIPYIINVIISVIVLCLNHLLTGQVLTLAFTAIGINLLFYSLIYTIVIIAVMMTGNLIVSLLGTGVFLLYGPMLMMIKELYFSGFFQTYYESFDTQDKIWQFLSPIGSYMDIANRSVDGKDICFRIIISFLVTVLMIGLALFLYRKRPSEAAGRAMTFARSKPIIKIILVITLTLGGGIMFRNIARYGDAGWLLFGLVFSFLVTYAIIEIIYNFDIRCAFMHKYHILFCAVVVTIVASIFQFDLFHYDSYVPKKDKIASMSIYVSGLDTNLRYNNHETGSPAFINSSTYQLNNMELTDIDAAYSLAELGTKRLDHRFDGFRKSLQYTVKYTLDSGRKIYRSYQINIEEGYPILKDIYINNRFKEVHYPIYQWDMSLIGDISCYNILDEVNFSLDSSEKKQLLKLYKNELQSLTLEDISSKSPVATLLIELNERPMDYYVYEDFHQTIDFLKEHGFDATKTIDSKDIKQIRIHSYNEKAVEIMNASGVEMDTAYRQEDISVTYTEQSEIDAIYPCLIQNEYYDNNYLMIEANEFIDVIVILKLDEFGNEQECSFRFRMDSIPEFVLKDIGYSVE